MNEIKKLCEQNNLVYDGCRKLVIHLVKTGWKHKDAKEHVKELITSGYLGKLKEILGGSGL